MVVDGDPVAGDADSFVYNQKYTFKMDADGNEYFKLNSQNYQWIYYTNTTRIQLFDDGKKIYSFYNGSTFQTTKLNTRTIDVDGDGVVDY